VLSPHHHYHHAEALKQTYDGSLPKTKIQFLGPLHERDERSRIAARMEEELQRVKLTLSENRHNRRYKRIN
jgi:hypothetical protein